MLWMELLFNFKVPLLKPKPKINIFQFYFEFFNIHIIHLTKFPMITMALKWHHKNILNKNYNSKRIFDGHPTWILVRLTVIAPCNQKKHIQSTLLKLNENWCKSVIIKSITRLWNVNVLVEWWKIRCSFINVN